MPMAPPITSNTSTPALAPAATAIVGSFPREVGAGVVGGSVRWVNGWMNGWMGEWVGG